MTTAHLRPCPGCSRHVRVSEGACPFCAASLDASFKATPAPMGPSRRLSRAALFAFGTGTLVLPAAAAIDCVGDIAPQPLYGGAYFPEDAGEDAGEEPQDSAPEASDGGGGNADAGDGSGEETGSDAGIEDAASDAPSDAGVDAESDAGDAD
jgi:hypothetical protein